MAGGAHSTPALVSSVAAVAVALLVVVQRGLAIRGDRGRVVSTPFAPVSVLTDVKEEKGVNHSHAESESKIGTYLHTRRTSGHDLMLTKKSAI